MEAQEDWMKGRKQLIGNNRTNHRRAIRSNPTSWKLEQLATTRESRESKV